MDLDLMTSATEFANLVDELCDVPRYAIDTEFVRERTYRPVLALVQIGWRGADGDKIALIDSMALDVSALRRVFEGPGLAVAHAAQQDIGILQAACSAAPKRLFDTQVAGAFLGFGTSSLSNMVRGVLGADLGKGDQLTDWTRRPLPESARRYAASDVEFLLELHDVLTARLEKLGRSEWAEDEMQRLLAAEHGPPDPDTRWWRLKGKARLRGKSRGVAQALTAWRERRAAERDIPVKRVMGDMAILAMAGRPPKNESELERVRGLGRLDGRTSRELMDAIREGAELQAPALKLPPDKPRGGDDKGPAAALCAAWVQHLSKQHDLEASLIATRDDLNALLRGDESRLDSGWRADIAGRSLRALLAGEAALRLDDGDLRLDE